jgi:hypothetical protein
VLGCPATHRERETEVNEDGRQAGRSFREWQVGGSRERSAAGLLVCENVCFKRRHTCGSPLLAPCVTLDGGELVRGACSPVVGAFRNYLGYSSEAVRSSFAFLGRWLAVNT